MKQIELNILQFILLIAFIYIFTYFWLPKINIYKTAEYTILANKYLAIVDEKDYWHNLYIQLYANSNYKISPDNSQSIGSKTSSHTSSINPRLIDSNDNDIISNFLY